jgi:hypothetical protein
MQFHVNNACKCSYDLFGADPFVDWEISYSRVQAQFTIEMAMIFWHPPLTKARFRELSR